MHILIIGGTLFLGRHIVERAVARGMTITLFNRGTTGPDLFPDVEQIRADRDGGMDALGDRTFDAVIDTCGYVPRIVEQAAAYLAPRCGFYIFISSMSVYADLEPERDEEAPLAKLSEPDTEDVQKHYGALKVACEQVVEHHFPNKSQHARAGFIIGPYDRIQRFPYWVRRLRHGGPTLAPGSPENPLQWIDARDLAEWLLDSAEAQRAGPFNLTGPETPRPIGEFLDRTNKALGNHAQLVWPGDAFLEENEVRPLDGLPYWIPLPHQGFCRRSIRRALEAGLRFRPVEDSARDTLAWMEREPQNSAPKTGVKLPPTMTIKREHELLARLQAH